MINKATNFIRHLWHTAPIATAILAAALCASLFFGARSFLYWYDRPPALDQAQPVAAWMTPRYVMRAWQVPPYVVRDAIGAPEHGQKGMTSLTQIAKERGVPIEQLLGDVQTAIIDFREAQND